MVLLFVSKCSMVHRYYVLQVMYGITGGPWRFGSCRNLVDASQSRGEIYDLVELSRNNIVAKTSVVL